MSTFSSDSQAGEQWKQITDKATALLADLPEYVTSFFGEYRRPIVTIGLIAGAIVAVKLTLAILGSINDIPLLAPSFELIGIGYSAWFIYRYLLKASNRKELSEDFNSLKSQVLGQRNNNGQ
ncbi:CAAD domain-containing protein [Leptolyngbya sp. AN02str]